MDVDGVPFTLQKLETIVRLWFWNDPTFATRDLKAELERLAERWTARSATMSDELRVRFPTLTTSSRTLTRALSSS